MYWQSIFDGVLQWSWYGFILGMFFYISGWSFSRFRYALEKYWKFRKPKKHEE